jgi:hypothetical protein
MRQFASDLSSTSPATVSGSSTQSCRTAALCFTQSFHAMMLTLADRLDIDVD